ncbi:MAG: universal stress protein [Pseudomonadota bacterium]
MKLQSALTILDKPKHDQPALKLAMQLQEQAQCHVDCVAFCWHPMGDAAKVFDTHQRRQIKQSIVSQRKQWQRDLIRDEGFAARDIGLRTAWTKEIADWVASAAAAKPTDLVIKTAHRRENFIHMPLDWKLLQSCPAPLLLTTDKPHKASGKIIAAVYLQHNDAKHRKLNERVLDAATTMATLTGGAVHCICVVEFSRPLADLDLIDVKKRRRELMTQEKAYLEALVGGYNIPKSRLHVPLGKVGEKVTQLSSKLGADMIVVGAHAQRVKERLHIGNTAERILARASADILSVPP